MTSLCRNCWRGKLGMDHTTPPVRTSRDPCDFCSAPGPNYSYPDELIPGTKGDVDRAAEMEERG